MSPVPHNPLGLSLAVACLLLVRLIGQGRNPRRLQGLTLRHKP
jgi:hypothetical protein